MENFHDMYIRKSKQQEHAGRHYNHLHTHIRIEKGPEIDHNNSDYF